MPMSKNQKDVVAYIKKHPNATIKEATNAITEKNGYAEVKALIDDQSLTLHGTTGYHTLTVPEEDD
jgi:hypothetical protein